MQTPTITYPAELQVAFSGHSSRKERLAAEHLRETYRALLTEANHLCSAIQTAQNNYQYLSGEKEIDACIYRIRTDQCRYASALNRMQELQIQMQNLTGH